MVIFMAGYPHVGKTFVVELLKAAIPEIQVISPKLLLERDSDYDKLEEEERHKRSIAAWDVTLQYLQREAHANSKDIFLYDSCCASYRVMDPFFRRLKKWKHKVLYAFVHASMDDIKARAGAKFDEDVIDKYTRNFEESIAHLGKLADWNVVVKNVGDGRPDIGKLLKVIHGNATKNG
jgi:hypothetical protein